MKAVSYFRGDIIIVFRQNLKRTELADRMWFTNKGFFDHSHNKAPISFSCFLPLKTKASTFRELLNGHNVSEAHTGPAEVQ